MLKMVLSTFEKLRSFLHNGFYVILFFSYIKSVGKKNAETGKDCDRPLKQTLAIRSFINMTKESVCKYDFGHRRSYKSTVLCIQPMIVHRAQSLGSRNIISHPFYY